MHMILTAELSSIILLDEAILLLKVNKNVDSVVELSRNRITVVIARILAVILRFTVVVLTEYSYVNLTSTFDVDR